jgi:hypothetical protein
MMNATQLAPRHTPSTAEPHSKSLSTQVRCFVYSVNDKCYRAECIDLDITAEGTTERAAKRGLRDAMVGYLNVVCDGHIDDLRDGDEKAFRKLILRPAPLTHRIHYYLGKVRQTASAKPRGPNHGKVRFYTLPAPCCCS